MLGKQVIIDNIPGGGGMSGSLRVSQAAPDGYQFVLGSIGTHALNQTLSKKPLYNAATDFAPVALVAEVGLVLLARKDLPANNLQEFIAYAKANQAKMQFGSGGAGTSSHIGCVLLNQTIGIDTVHVPYRGGGPALADLIAGRIDYLCNIASTVGQALETKRVKALAALTRERSPILPDLPTAHEQGLTDFDAYTWNAVFLPKGTPPELVEQAQRCDRQGDGQCRRSARGCATLGLIVPVPERRTPDYLGKFVAQRDRQMGGADQGERRHAELIAARARVRSRHVMRGLVPRHPRLRKQTMDRRITARPMTPLQHHRSQHQQEHHLPKLRKT